MSDHCCRMRSRQRVRSCLSVGRLLAPWWIPPYWMMLQQPDASGLPHVQPQRSQRSGWLQNIRYRLLCNTKSDTYTILCIPIYMIMFMHHTGLWHTCIKGCDTLKAELLGGLRGSALKCDLHAIQDLQTSDSLQLPIETRKALRTRLNSKPITYAIVMHLNEWTCKNR